MRRLDREMPHIRDVLARLTEPPVHSGRLAQGLETAVGLTDYWLGRHAAEGLSSIGQLLAAAGTDEPPIRGCGPPPSWPRATLPTGSRTSRWVPQLVEQAEALFAELGDPLGEGRALRRRGAIAAATDDLPAARRFLEASLARFEEAGVDNEVGTTLLHLGSLLADEGVVDAARPALERAHRIAMATGDPLANGHVLGALNLAYWKAGDLEAAMQAGNEALLIFRELGHRPTEGTVAYRLAAVARGLGRPRAARRYAELAVAAGEQASTSTTIALGDVNLARLDLDAGDLVSAAGHLVQALQLIDPVADRWVLVEALEAVARLLVGTDPGVAGRLLAAAAAIRAAIRQPVAPTEVADLEWTLSASRSGEGSAGQALPGEGDPIDAAEAQQLALDRAREAGRADTAPRRTRRARG